MSSIRELVGCGACAAPAAAARRAVVAASARPAAISQPAAATARLGSLATVT